MSRRAGRQRFGRNVERVGIDVRKDRLRTDVVNRAGGREECEWRGQNFVATSDVEGAQRQQNRIGAVRYSDRVRCVRKQRDLALEPFDWLAQDECLLVDDFRHRVHDGITDRYVLRFQIEKRYGHLLVFGMRFNRNR